MPLASSATPTKPSCRSVLRDAEFSRSPGAGAAAKTKRGAALAAGAAAPPPPSEFQKLRATLEQLKLDASQPASGRSSPYHRRDEPAPPAPEQLNAKVKAVKQAVQMLSESVEEEVASLRAADEQVWAQLKAQASRTTEYDALAAAHDKLRAELRTTKAAHADFVKNEHEPLKERLDELAAEVAEVRESAKKARAADQRQLEQATAESSAARRWRAEIAEPKFVASERELREVKKELEKIAPPLKEAIAELDGRVAAALPELARAADAADRRARAANDAVAPLPAQIAAVRDAHEAAVPELAAAARAAHDEARAAGEAAELRGSQCAAELAQHAESLRLIAADAAATRGEWRDEVDAVAAQAKAAAAAAAQASEAAAAAALVGVPEVGELQRGLKAAAAREAQTMEAVLSLRAAQTQSLGWMEHHQREAAANKGAIEQVRADQERGLAGAAEAAHAVRQQWEREVAALDARLADVVKALERQHGERAALQATNAAVDALRREMSDARRVDQLAVRRLKEVVESRALMPPPEPRPPRAMTHAAPPPPTPAADEGRSALFTAARTPVTQLVDGLFASTPAATSASSRVAPRSWAS